GGDFGPSHIHADASAHDKRHGIQPPDSSAILDLKPWNVAPFILGVPEGSRFPPTAMIALQPAGSSLHPGIADAFDEIPLEEQIQEDDGKGEKGVYCHNTPPLPPLTLQAEQGGRLALGHHL